MKRFKFDTCKTQTAFFNLTQFPYFPVMDSMHVLS